MNRDRNRIWYDVTMSLSYPSILGAIIYFFFDATIQVTLIPFLDRMSAMPNVELASSITQFYFFENFGLSTGFGFVVFIIVTLLVSIHHSVDYLYSKYSEFQYNLTNFVWDTIISLFLAIAYIVISRGATKNFYYIKISFVIFWLSLACTYIVFLWWDIKAYFELRNSDEIYAKFYREMVWWFEVSGIISFLLLAIAPIFIKKVGWFSFTYVIVSITALAIFTFWFCGKVKKLENISRELDSNLMRFNKMSSLIIPSDALVSINNMCIGDIAECASIFSETYQKVYSEPWTIETSKARISEIYKDNPDYCFVLKINDLIAGFLLARNFTWFDGPRIWLEEIVVQEIHRNKGFGKLLLSTLFNRCKKENSSGISLISHKGSDAYKIYKKMKFKPSNWIHLEIDLDDN